MRDKASEKPLPIRSGLETSVIPNEYVVVRSDERYFSSAKKIENFYVISASLIIATAILNVIDSVFHFGIATLIFDALGIGANLYATLGVIFVNVVLVGTSIFYIIFAKLMQFAIDRNYGWLASVISSLTLAWALPLFAICTALAGYLGYLELQLSQDMSNNQTEAVSPLVSFSIFVVICFYAIFALVCLKVTINCIMTFIENFRFKPDSARYSNGLVIESAQEEDVTEIAELLLSANENSRENLRSRSITKNEVWTKFMEPLDLEDIRIARLPGVFLGFLTADMSTKVITSIHLSQNLPIDAEECLVQDFVRRSSRSDAPVSTVRINSSYKKLQKILMENGWTLSQETPPNSSDMIFNYSNSSES